VMADIMTSPYAAAAELFDTGAALAAPTLGAALAIRERQGAAARDQIEGLPAYHRGAVHAVWLDTGAAVLGHWGQVARAGLTDDGAVMALPNPAHADAA